ncbi:sensor histidine kinase [Rheinheimera sp. SA_1]|uniref:sensor histidine kinase n=1 Tax=Rheinheimera sp. SA_1 TaxID=1827365 RepID=UPI000B222327|nr:histidine kinase [Rheinheimera sp. SA_1]
MNQPGSMQHSFLSADAARSSGNFWLYQSLGWSLFALLQLLLVGADQPLTLSSLTPALLLLALAICGTLPLRLLFRRLRRRPRSTAATLGWLFGAPLLLSICVDVSHYLLLWPLSQLHPTLNGVFDAQPLGAKTPFLLPLYIFWSSLYLTLSRQLDIRAAEQAKLGSELRLQQSQLQILLAQLSPHFMFNCINNIRALILEDPQAARSMLAHFADMLRYQIDADQQVLVPLRSELAVLKDYAALLHIQFEQRLQLDYQIDPSCLSRLLPKLTLQLLFENAVKHGISLQPQGGRISLQINALDAVGWQIRMRNSGQLQVSTATTSENNSENNTGSGLSNLRQRLALIFGEKATLQLQQQADEVVATLQILAAPRETTQLATDQHSSTENLR